MVEAAELPVSLPHCRFFDCDICFSPLSLTPKCASPLSDVRLALVLACQNSTTSLRG